MFQSGGICALSCCLISFLRSWEACLSWDLFQTKGNLFLSNKAMWVCFPAAAGRFWAWFPLLWVCRAAGVPQGNKSALRFFSVRGSSREVGRQPGRLQPQPSARLRLAERLEAGERCQGNSPPCPGRAPQAGRADTAGPGQVLHWQRRGVTLLPFRASALAVILPALAVRLLLV